MSERLPPKIEQGEGKAADFSKNLNSLKFDERDLQNEMSKILAKSVGYSLIKGEIANKADASMTEINAWNVESYVKEQGGQEFLKKIYEKGVAGLRNSFNNQKTKLKANIALLLSDKKDFKTESFKDSKVAEDIRRVATECNVEVADLTFEQAYEHGLFSNSLKPTMKGVAEYGLTWFEYSNRATRQAKLKRKKQSASVSDETTISTDKEDKKGPEKPVKLDKKLPKIEAKGEGESSEKKLRDAKEELLTIGKPYLEDLVSGMVKRNPDLNLQMKVEIINNGMSLRLVDGEDVVLAVNIIRVPGGEPIFVCNMREFRSGNEEKVWDEAQKKLGRYVEHKRFVVQDVKDRKANLEKKENQVWKDDAKGFILSLDGRSGISVQNDSDGVERYFGDENYKVPSNFVIYVGGNRYNAELNVGKKALIFRAGYIDDQKVKHIYTSKPFRLRDLKDPDRFVESLAVLPQNIAEERKALNSAKNP